MRGRMQIINRVWRGKENRQKSWEKGEMERKMRGGRGDERK